MSTYNLNLWFQATKPKTLLAGIAPVILGTGLSFNYTNTILPIVAIVTILCTVFLQIGTNLVNDYFDFLTGIDNKFRLGPQRMSISGAIAPAHIKTGFLISFILSFLLGIYLMNIGGLPIIIIGLTSIVFAYIYTGGPFPLSHYPLGELLAFIFFGPIAVWGTFYLQTKVISPIPILIGAGQGLTAAVIMSVNNLRDSINDKKHRKNTLFVLLGEKRGRKVSLIFIIGTMLIPIFHYLIFSKNVIILLNAFVPLLFYKTWLEILNAPITSELNLTLGKAGLFSFVYSVIYSLTLIIVS